jgi:hypothetical protein
VATEETNLEIALLDSIASSDLKSLAIGGTEILLDSVLDDGVLKDIPVIGVVARLSSAGIRVREALFAKKLLSFLIPLSDISETERAEYLVKLDRDGGKERIAQALLLIIERLDDLMKPEILARIVKEAILGNITTDEMLRMAAVVDKILLADLLVMKSGEGRRLGTQTLSALLSVGCAEIKLIHPTGEVTFPHIEGERPPVDLRLEISPFGWEFAYTALGVPRPTPLPFLDSAENGGES